MSSSDKPASFANTVNHDALKRAYGATNPEESRLAYDDWAAKYDEDLAAQGYIAPTVVARAILTHYNGTTISGPILDAGCGTGLSGIALAQELPAKTTIDGLDFSPGMLKIAEKTGVYKNLAVADLTKPLTDQQDESYHVVACVGTLTKGHVGPRPALGEFVRIVRSKGGIVAVTILEDVFESDGFKDEVERLKGERFVEVLQSELVKIGARNGVDIKSRLVVLRKK